MSGGVSVTYVCLSLYVSSGYLHTAAFYGMLLFYVCHYLNMSHPFNPCDTALGIAFFYVG